MTSWGIDGINRIPTCDLGSLAVNESVKSNSELKIYPNPAKNEVTVKFRSTENNINLQIIDFSGKIVLNKDAQSSTGDYNEKLNISALPNATYFVVVKEGTKRTQKTLIKN